MAVKKAKGASTEIVTGMDKLARMNALIEEQKALASKSDSELIIGHLEDFELSGRNKYMLTNILGVDLNTYGVKKGGIHVVYGPESSGKSTITLSMVEGMQFYNPNLTALFIDSEGTVDEKFADRMPYLDRSRVTFMKPESLEKTFDFLNKRILPENIYDVIIYDSVDTAISEKELSGSLEDNPMMVKPKQLSRALAETNSHLIKSDTSFIMIQQERVEMMGHIVKQNGRSGGKAMRYYPCAILRTRVDKGNSEIDPKTNTPSTNYVEITAEKSKISTPKRKTNTYINVSEDDIAAINRIKEVVDYGIAYGFFERAGAWYNINLGFDEQTGEAFELPGMSGKVQGKANLESLLLDNIDVYSYMKFRIYAEGLEEGIFINQHDQIKAMLKRENAAIKNFKMEQYMLKGFEVEESDKIPLDFSRYNCDLTVMMGKDRREQGEYLNLSYNERQEYMASKRKTAEAEMKAKAKAEKAPKKVGEVIED